jgi:hypothetical protein
MERDPSNSSRFSFLAELNNFAKQSSEPIQAELYFFIEETSASLLEQLAPPSKEDACTITVEALRQGGVKHLKV